jgi:hypothetical protein
LPASLPDSADAEPGPADPLVGGLGMSARIRGSEGRLAAETVASQVLAVYSIRGGGAVRGGWWRRGDSNS